MRISNTLLPTAQQLIQLLQEFEGQLAEDVVRGLISLAPTRHRVALSSGTRLFTYCALDTLLIPRLLGEDAQLFAQPIDESDAVPYAITAGQLHGPDGVVIAFPQVHTAEAGEFKGDFCPYANLFHSIDDYRLWAAKGTVPTQALTLAQADHLALDYAQHIHKHAPKVCGCGCGM